MIEWELRLNLKGKEKKTESFRSWMNDQSSRILIGAMREGWNEFLYTDRLSFTHCWTIKQSKFTEYAYRVNWTWLCNGKPIVIVKTFVPVLWNSHCFDQRRKKKKSLFWKCLYFKTGGNSVINYDTYVYYVHFYGLSVLISIFFYRVVDCKDASLCNLVVPRTYFLVYMYYRDITASLFMRLQSLIWNSGGCFFSHLNCKFRAVACVEW